MRTVCAGWGAALLALAVAACAGAGVYQKGTAQRTPLVIEVITDEPAQAAAAPVQRSRVLIYHTHTWEAFEMTQTAQYTPTQTWRTKEDAHNMIRVGEELARLLDEKGFDVTHDRTAFEPPNLSSAYTRSLAMLKDRQSAGEVYDYYLDVHRDAYSGDWNGDNCVTGEDGTRRAYVMMLVGKGTGTTGAGFDERPDWPKNLALAQAITDAMNMIEPGISRNVKTKTGRFNQHISTGALLIEVGNNKNTLEEALSACPVIAEAIDRVDRERTGQP